LRRRRIVLLRTNWFFILALVLAEVQHPQIPGNLRLSELWTYPGVEKDTVKL
jgi:hypothetical protein